MIGFNGGLIGVQRTTSVLSSVPGVWTLPEQVVARSAGRWTGNWTPANIATALWLDAADSSSITESGGAVSQWNDKSGNGRNATQSTNGNQPTYNATQENGKGAVIFNGSSRQLTFPESNASGYPLKFGTASFELYCVINPSSLTAAISVFFGARKFDIGWMVGFNNNSPAFRMYNSAERWSPSPMSGVTATTGRQIFSATAPRLSTGEYRKNGALLQSTTSAVGSDTMNNDAFVRVGAYSDSSGNPTGFFTGNICELILIGGTLITGSDREKMEGYLAHKWGLTANLPSGHPYKTYAP